MAATGTDAAAALAKAQAALDDAEGHAVATMAELQRNRETLVRVAAATAAVSAGAHDGRAAARRMAKREGWRGLLPWNWG
jgi:hypothetical protein